MPSFEEFVQTELPKRPFCSADGSQGQVLMRSTNAGRPLELVWATPGEQNPTTYIASENLSGHRIVVLSALGVVSYASNQTANHADSIFGMTKSAALMSDQVQVARVGEEIVEPTWSWVTGQVLFLGVDGALIQSEPISPALFSLIVEFATSPTSILLDVREPIFLG